MKGLTFIAFCENFFLSTTKSELGTVNDLDAYTEELLYSRLFPTLMIEELVTLSNHASFKGGLCLKQKVREDYSYQNIE